VIRSLLASLETILGCVGCSVLVSDWLTATTLVAPCMLLVVCQVMGVFDSQKKKTGFFFI
jgi:hypothetical protein